MARGVNKVILADLYKSGLSLPEVSAKTGIPLSTLRFRFKKIGILRSRTEAVRLSAKHGNLGSGMRGKKRTFSDQHKKNMSEARKGKGRGISLKPSGYLEITMGENKGRGQHVIIMEDKIGRKLLPNECVHHKNGEKHDNVIENLEVMTRSEHARHHALENNANRKRDKNGRYS